MRSTPLLIVDSPAIPVHDARRPSPRAPAAQSWFTPAGLCRARGGPDHRLPRLWLRAPAWRFRSTGHAEPGERPSCGIGAGSADAERRALGEVVRSYTAYLARVLRRSAGQTGIAAPDVGHHGQMDCLDETANTTSLLLVSAGPGSSCAPSCGGAPGIAGLLPRWTLPAFHRGDRREADRGGMGGGSRGGRPRGRGRISCRSTMAAGFLKPN